MDITQFSEALRRDLTQAAQAGTDEIRAAAERLSLALDPAVRLTLMEALAEAAAEITHQLEGSSIEVRLKGRDPVFVVVGGSAPPDDGTDTGPDEEATEANAASEDDDSDDDVVRITLRLPESLKARAETLAARRGQSLNTWLVTAARHAAHMGSSSTGTGRGAPGRNRSSSKRIQGWVR